MKCTKLKHLLLILISVLSISFSLNGQSWDWQWGKDAEVSNKGYQRGLEINFGNEIYTCFTYRDEIYIGDTVFSHYNPHYDSYDDVAIIRYDELGNIKNVIDVYTPPTDHINLIDMDMDNDSCIYLYGTFRDTLFVNGHIILPNHTESWGSIFLLKLSHELEFVWCKTISAWSQCFARGLEIDEFGQLYVSSSHIVYSNDTIPRYVNIFGQDSLLITKGLNTLVKIDNDGNVIWIGSITVVEDKSTEVRMLKYGQDGFLYIFGRSAKDIIINRDTIINPYAWTTYEKPFIVKMDKYGLHHSAFFYDIPNFAINPFFSIEIDTEGNFYVSGILYDDCIWGTDTLQIPYNKLGLIVGKLDTAFNPLWCEYIDDKTWFSRNFIIDVYNDSLYIAFTATSSITFAGIDFSFGGYWNSIIGKFDPNGNFIHYEILPKSSQARIGIETFKIDRCGNYLLSGWMNNGDVYFGQDTLHSGSNIIAYLARSEITSGITFPLSQDTIVCEHITLYGPSAYSYYEWNGELTNDSTYLVTSTGPVYLRVANMDGCWHEGSCFIEVIPQLDINLGPDTTVCEHITLYGPSAYSYYEWNGELTNDSTYLVTSTGLIYLRVANEDSCWHEGSCFIEVIPQVDINLGDDTTIFITDSIILSIPGNYESYLWSTGDTTSSILLAEENLVIGNNIVWLELSDGPCMSTDTISILMIDIFNIDEDSLYAISFYPNPASEYVTIQISESFLGGRISIHDINGIELIDQNIDQLTTQINIAAIPSGIYILRVIKDEELGYTKFIKL